MAECCDSVFIEQVKVILPAGSLTAQNGLTLTGLNLELSGSLIHNTDITGAYQLNLGTSASRLTQLNLRVSNQLLLEFNNGVVNANLAITSTGLLLTDNSSPARGLVGAADYSSNYNSNTYTQKVYVDSHLVSKAISGILAAPGVGENNFVISWNNTANQFTLVPITLPTVGSNTQIIFNDFGLLSGNANFTFNKTTGELSSGPLFTLKDIATAHNVDFTASGSGDIAMNFNPLGEGNINMNLRGAAIFKIGASNNTTSVKIVAAGSSGTLNLVLSPKGSAGAVQIGDYSAGGSTRNLEVVGSASDIDLVLVPKGTGIINASGKKITNAATATNPSDLVRFDQLPVIIPSDTYTKVIDIGSWNAYGAGGGTSSVNVVHGLPLSKIRSITALVRDDGGTLVYPSGTSVATGVQDFWVNSASLGFAVSIQRRAGGVMDSIGFSGTGFNRGWVVIELIP